MSSIQISRIVSWDLYWTAVLLKQKVKDKMFYTIPNTLKRGFLSGEQFVLSSSSITKSIILESLTGWQHTHAGLHKHGTHTQMQTDTQTNRNMQDLVWGHTLLHVNSNDVSFWVIFSFQQEHRNNEDIRGQQTERKTKRLCLCVCVCVFTTQQSIWRSQRWIHWTLFFPPLLSQSLFVFQNPVKCLGSFIVLIDVHCTTEIITVAQVAPVIFCLYIQHQHHGWY